jgi:hypothetical protein
MQTQPRSLLLPLSTPFLITLRVNNVNIDNSAADSGSTLLALSSTPSRYLILSVLLSSSLPLLVSSLHSATPHLQYLVMNEDLIERFKRGQQGRSVNRTHVELRILPQKLNNKVSKYFEPLKKPSDAGPWLDRHESPTSSEILDIEGDNSSNSDIVAIVPNKETGGWESKGEPLQLSNPYSLQHLLISLQTPTCRLTMNFSGRMPFALCAKLYVKFGGSRIATRMPSKVPSGSIRM